MRCTTKRLTLCLLTCAACAASLAVPALALAQDNEEGFNKDGDDTIAADKQASEEKKTGDKMPGERDKKAEETVLETRVKTLLSGGRCVEKKRSQPAFDGFTAKRGGLIVRSVQKTITNTSHF